MIASIAMMDDLKYAPALGVANNYGKLTTKLPHDVRLWLASKGVIDDMRRVNNLYWHEQGQELVMPIYDDNGKMIFSANRYFGKDEDHPKYINYGSLEDHIPLVGNPDSPILFIVEDYISALRIAHTESSKVPLGFCAMPMYGSIPQHNHMIELADRFCGVVFFLDADKHMESYKLKKKYEHNFIWTGYIHALKDPKDYKTEELREALESQTKLGEHHIIADGKDENQKQLIGWSESEYC